MISFRSKVGVSALANNRIFFFISPFWGHFFLCVADAARYASYKLSALMRLPDEGFANLNVRQAKVGT